MTLTLDGIEFEVEFSGHKSSESDGRTAADIEQEMLEAEEINDGTQ